MPAATPPFRKLLIANRGEIAVRIARACRELGVASVAVHSEADADALHVELADEAVCCGPAPARDSYLASDRIVELARKVGADAVHPGYGFLSESASFARAVSDAGLAFVGPPADTIRLMGDKVAARRRMSEVGVPVLPGSLGPVSDDEAPELARALGFPVLLKASAGGGGRGMRLVRDADELVQALPRARSEAERGFGDPSVYLERFLDGARHVEVQIVGDAHGSCVHLFERACSVQRRHQKLIEEAPAPGLTTRAREQLCQTALRAARAVDYAGAGTVEFLLEPSGRAWFLEMNTRVQVEHAITEQITGVDIVKLGIRVAAGWPLALEQSQVGIFGHALECRIYAEDPERGFLPSPGTLSAYRTPGGPGVRVDSGVREGAVVSPHYDALLAKLVCWGRDRDEALARGRRALDELWIEGVHTTRSFQRRVLDHPAFVSGVYDTRLVDQIAASDRA